MNPAHVAHLLACQVIAVATVLKGELAGLDSRLESLKSSHASDLEKAQATVDALKVQMP